MKKVLIGICALLCLVSCTKKDNGKILATVDKDKITMEEFNKELDKIPMNMKMMVASESGKKSYLDRLIMKKLLLREADKAKIAEDKEFQQRLADIKEQLIVESLIKKKLFEDARLSDEEIKKFYDANKEKYKKESEINTRHILVKTEEEAKQIREKLQSGEDFVNLAKQYSIDPNAKSTGGELGFHPKGTILPEYEEAAFKLTKVGQISPIVKTQFGYHIIRLEGTKPPSYVGFEEVKEMIKQQLLQEKQKELFEKYIDGLKKNAKITINETLLKEEKKEPADNSKSSEKKPEANNSAVPATEQSNPSPEQKK